MSIYYVYVPIESNNHKGPFIYDVSHFGGEVAVTKLYFG